MAAADGTHRAEQSNSWHKYAAGVDVLYILITIAVIAINILGWMGKIPGKSLAIANLALSGSIVLLAMIPTCAIETCHSRKTQLLIGRILLLAALFTVPNILWFTGHLSAGDLAKIAISFTVPLFIMDQSRRWELNSLHERDLSLR